jgi:hypothetical protein
MLSAARQRSGFVCKQRSQAHDIINSIAAAGFYLPVLNHHG